MFIELTDHLRCPMVHAESFLVLLPERAVGRRVEAGELGCPVCNWSVVWDDGVPDFGGGTASSTVMPFDADAAIAMLGTEGPGGWLATAGSAGSIAHEIAAALPGVHVVAINPSVTVRTSGAVSVIRSGAWPLRSASMRGLVMGSDAQHREAAMASVLPGLRACGTGDLPEGADLVARGGEAWVVKAG